MGCPAVPGQLERSAGGSQEEEDATPHTPLETRPSEWMPIPEAGLALKHLVAWAGLRCGSLSFAWGTGARCHRWMGLEHEPSEQKPL